MSVGLLLITHNRIGQELLSTAIATFGRLPLETFILPVSSEEPPEGLLIKAKELSAKLNTGDGVLVLTDLYGATPSNIAAQLSSDDDVIVISGVNLPMLMRIFNYSNLELPQLAYKALSGGNAGIVLCPKNYDSA